jgi:hypothetical protein
LPIALHPRGYLFAALLAVLLPYARAGGTEPATAGSAIPTLIYVVRRGWHIDVGFAAADVQPPLNSVAAQFPGVRYLFFGFGDRHYLLAKNRNAPVVLGALWPGRGLILATALGSSPQEAFGATHVIALAVSQGESRRAQEFIWRSLDQQSTPYAPGPYEGSLYFAATPRYSALHTCNTWAAQSLAAAALPIHSTGVLFAGQLWSQVRRLEKKQSTAALRGVNQVYRTDPLRGTGQLQGGFDPSWQTTVVPEF